MDKRLKLTELLLQGFKSISEREQKICFGDINVFIGANGAGKSNLVSFFKMLNNMTTGALQQYIGEQGFADSLLYYGSKNTSRIKAELVFEQEDRGQDRYFFALSHASGDTLIFTEEYAIWHQKGFSKPVTIDLKAGHKESGLYNEAKNENKTGVVIYSLLKNCKAFQFHDTSKNSRIRNQCFIENNEFLYDDGGNLAAYLYVLKEKQEWEKYYQRIVRYIQIVMPQFGDFSLKPSALNNNYILLNWIDRYRNNYVFGSHQISDGSLRFMALATLLLQPPEKLPNVIIIDEPELGLHPSAITALAGMIKTASVNCQVIIATQSTGIIDEFEAKDIIIVERDEKSKSSVFKRLDEQALDIWLREYSLSELWEKNVLGGRP